MGIKRIIKQICYGANRNSREEIMSAMENIRAEMRHLCDCTEKEIQLLRQDIGNLELQLQNVNRDVTDVIGQLQNVNRQIDKLDMNGIHTQIDVVQRDILLAISQRGSFVSEKRVKVLTDYPIAYESNDYLHPWGTKNDDTRAPYFVQKCEEILGENLNFMDLGCSGGGLVLDEILKGHFAIGLEGSDYSKKRQRAEWRLLKNNLFTCDVCKPFEVLENETGIRMKFEIITAWELLEHIREEDLSVLLKNIYNHLSDEGYFVGTMSQSEDVVNDVIYHHTIKPYSWWKELFEKNNFAVVEDLFLKEDLARGNGNPPNCWMINWGEENSSYIVAKKR